MKSFYKVFAGFLLLVFYSAGFAVTPSPNSEIKTYKIQFQATQDVTVAYADYPKGEEAFYELESIVGAFLPNEIISSTPSLKIAGNNHSDDLFMYAYTKIAGLKPNTTYQAQFILEFASNAQAGSSGIGGSPGDSVYVKVGAVPEEPSRYVDEAGLYRMNLDKGNQAEGGKDMILMGDFGVDTHDEIYRLKSLSNRSDNTLDAYTVTTNDRGEVWLVFGTDSGYEGKTVVYYTNLVAGFKIV